MIIEYLQAGPYVEHFLEGRVLQVGDISIDLAERQDDSQVVIDITRNGNGLVEGVSGKDGYVANILLPPREYEEIETDVLDMNGNNTIERRALPLSTGKACIKLWQFKPIEPSSETT